MRALLKTIFGLFWLLSWTLGSSATAQETAPSVAVLTGLSGPANHRSAANDEPAALQPFQQLSTDDLMELSSGSTVTIVFYSGRKEIWEGPVKLRVLENNSESLSGPASAPLREEIPTDVKEDLRRLPEIMGNTRAAVTIVLAPNAPGTSAKMDCRQWQRLQLTAQEQGLLRTARKKYETMRSRTADHDLTPEAYLLSVLGQYDQYDEIITLLDRLESRHPDTGPLQTFRDRAMHCKPYLQTTG